MFWNLNVILIFSVCINISMSYFILFYNINKALCCGSFICDHINSITQLLDFPFQAHFPPKPTFYFLSLSISLSFCLVCSHPQPYLQVDHCDLSKYYLPCAPSVRTQERLSHAEGLGLQLKYWSQRLMEELPPKARDSARVTVTKTEVSDFLWLGIARGTRGIFSLRRAGSDGSVVCRGDKKERVRDRGREPTSRSFQPESHYSGKLIQEFNNGWRVFSLSLWKSKSCHWKVIDASLSLSFSLSILISSWFPSSS